MTIKSPLYKVLILGMFATAMAFANPQWVRWTGQQDANADLAHVLSVLKAKTGIELTQADLFQVEDRDLAHNHFRMLSQMAAGAPIDRQSIRLWTDLKTGATVQIEALVDKPPARAKELMWAVGGTKLTSEKTLSLVRDVIARHSDDKELRSVDWKDLWSQGHLIRRVKVKSHSGTHEIEISLAQRIVTKYAYHEFPQADQAREGEDEFSIPVQIYPVYEKAEGSGTLQARSPSSLHYIKKQVARVTSDPYAPLRQLRYFEEKYDPVYGLTEQGRRNGFWAMSYVKDEAHQILEGLPTSANDFANGVLLVGRNTTVSLYPEVPQAFPGINFTPGISPQFKPDWKPRPEDPAHLEMIPSAALLGRPLASADEALSRPARVLENNDAATYLNDGFDEIQVYWAVNQLFDSLRPMGFTDPELSTRRFNAFLYDPDITYRDNAFYTDDTINFTTYSPGEPNMARDNTTIWHELGHGVMDRLMGDEIRLADTGGLSEGMADFVAQLVVNDVTDGKPFEGKQEMRIFNNTGFYLTNEVHDDGEAYGGTMNDLLIAAMKAQGHTGLVKVTDLTLETMRLARNHPALTANEWFSHMQFADEIGNEPVRHPGELKPFILAALGGRNFNLDGSPSARLIVMQGGHELTSETPGSRENPIVTKIPVDGSSSYHLDINLKSSPGYQFHYPVTLKVAFKGGALEGSLHWVGEENGALQYTLNSEKDTIPVDLTVTGKCDAINRPDGSCSDYAYVQVWNAGETGKPRAKKRFYVRVIPQS